MPDHFSPEIRSRILMTTSCKDSDAIPKVSNAGETLIENNERIQILHNGVKIIEDCYYGNWITEVIRRLNGCHEPQEEAVFHRILEKMQQDTSNPVVLELGAYWAYYSLWILQQIPEAKSYLVEPDPLNLAAGKKNFQLNGRKGNFLQAAIGAHSLSSVEFKDGSGTTHHIPMENLP